MYIGRHALFFSTYIATLVGSFSATRFFNMFRAKPPSAGPAAAPGSPLLLNEKLLMLSPLSRRTTFEDYPGLVKTMDYETTPSDGIPFIRSTI